MVDQEVQTIQSSNIAGIKRQPLWEEFHSHKAQKVDRSSDKVQIQVGGEEIRKRQAAFIEMKQEQNNVSNQQEFVNSLGLSSEGRE